MCAARRAGRRTRARSASTPALCCSPRLDCRRDVLSKPPDEPKDYAAKIAAERAAKDAAFAARRRSDPEGAARRVPAARATFRSIRTTTCRRRSSRSTITTIIEMPTSTGTNRKMRRVGTLEFTLKGQPMKLHGFIEVGDRSRAICSCRSAISPAAPKPTPPAASWISTATRTGIYEVDFNRAYIPYCYYNPTYECPYPPPENRLKIPDPRRRADEESQ